MNKDKNKQTTGGGIDAEGINNTNLVDSWALRLVNSENYLPEDFAVTTAAIVGGDGKEFDSRAVESLNQMLADGKAKGLDIVVCSAYRTVDYQTGLFDKSVKKYMGKGMTEAEAKAKTATEIAIPGTSEHNLGLAVDLVARSYQDLEDDQEDTAENKWLQANCTKYGFILRYPKDKQDITKIIYEPWHFRYVGVEAAAEITEKGVCLEEYLSAKGK